MFKKIISSGDNNIDNDVQQNIEKLLAISIELLSKPHFLVQSKGFRSEDIL